MSQSTPPSLRVLPPRRVAGPAMACGGGHTTTRQSAPLRRIGTFGLAVELVWAFYCQAFLCSTWKSRFFAPTRSVAKPARAGAVKVGRDTNLSTSFGLARPYLDI
jgi:hypothetical protein